MREIDDKTMQEIREIVYDYFSEECDVPRAEITDATDIIDELEGDSLMLLSLLDIFRRKHGLTVELKTLGKHLMKKPANTVGQVIELTAALVRYGNDIVKMDL
jgi:acyl carrier protein